MKIRNSFFILFCKTVICEKQCYRLELLVQTTFIHF